MTFFTKKKKSRKRKYDIINNSMSKRCTL